MRVLQSAILILVAALALAAQQMRSVSGTVRDQDGRPVSGAVVQLTDMKSQNIRSCITQPDGTYRFGSVSVDQSYRLQAKLRDFSGHVRHLSQFDGRETPVINLTIDLNRWSRRH